MLFAVRLYLAELHAESKIISTITLVLMKSINLLKIINHNIKVLKITIIS